MKRPYQIDPRPCQDFMWLPDSATVEQVVEQLQNMRRMESTTFRRCDYLYSHDSPYNMLSSSSSSSLVLNDASLMNEAMYVLGPISPPPSTAAAGLAGSSERGSSSSRSSSSSSLAHQDHCPHPCINETTRQMMIDLLYEIGDYCHFRRETVAHAIWNIMDRYLSLKDHKPLETKADFQLIASTSLYIAVKLLEPVSMDVQSLAELSKGAFSAQDILDMEKHILFALKWAVSHGPTPIGFVQLYLTLLQMDGLVLSEWELWDNLLEQAQYQVELSVVNYNLVTRRNPSEIALAAVWNALESQLECDLAMQWQGQLMDYLPPNIKRHLPKIQLTLCKLQYTAEAHYRERQHPTTAAATSAQGGDHAKGAQQEEGSYYYYEDDDYLPLDQDAVEYRYPEDDEEKLDMTERNGDDLDEDDASLARYLFPSPTSVATNQFSYLDECNTTKEEVQKKKKKENVDVGVPLHQKKKRKESTCYYGLNFLRNLFSF